MNNRLKHSRLEHYLSKALLALNVFLWLLCLPFILRIFTVPVLLERLALRRQCKFKASINFNDAVGVVARVSNLKLFHSRIFPKLCLRQSLALYRTLTRMGYPVMIHFGVLKNEKDLQGHSWITVEGRPVADTARSEMFKTIYSYCSDIRGATECRENKPTKETAVLRRV